MAQGVFPAGALLPARGGLLSTANVTEYQGIEAERWASGPIAWDTQVSPTELILADFCTNTDRGVIAESSGGPSHAWPFGIVTNHECVTLGITPDERAAIAVAQNIAGTQKALERELWAGQIAQASNRLDIPFLMDNAAVDVSGGAAVSVKVAIAKLEQALGDIGLGLQGTIHLTRQVASLALAVQAAVWEKDILCTSAGTPIIAGVGYDPSLSPTNPAFAPVPTPGVLGAQPATQWGFATGPVYAHLGASSLIGEYLDHSSNTLSVVAGRTAAVYWDSSAVASVQIKTTPLEG